MLILAKKGLLAYLTSLAPGAKLDLLHFLGENSGGSLM